MSKRFGGTAALAGVDLDLRRGSVLALLGENGAGKSTLIKILAGVHSADEGRITVAGHPFGTEAASRAMSFIHQDLGLLEWMTVAENIALGAGYARRCGLISWHRTRDRCISALRSVATGIDPDQPIADLTRTERSLVAVARALATDAQAVILDEPTASLPAADCARLFGVLRALRDQGRGIMYVTHRLHEVAEVADTVAVLRDGRLVRHGPVAGGAEDLVRDVVGHHPGIRRRSALRAGEVVLTLTGVRTGRAGPVSLELRAGEVLGLVGLTGAGHTDIGRAAAGACPLAGGRVLLDGRAVAGGSVFAAVRAGVGLVASDRAAEGSAPHLSVRENLLPNPRLRALPPVALIGTGRERAAASRLLAMLDVRPPDTEAPFAALSGGNQQKVLIGRWLGIRRRVLVLEEPTAGVDVGARAEIHRLLDDSVAEGLAVLLVSTDVDEVVRLCHRVLVFARGVVTAELSGAELTAAAVVHAMSAGPGQGTTGH
ncbi:sugar ABC transporter ATP-binding protein [Actinoallomurus purpureus]|uniref:sugar ABC transporter ATP-binding protein n=1 Tax=Actinoallomurus purpureus TaxID=478114 RepID=UPI002091F723|nr:sugar ABC transporter ATP-binding protein [Actinoallomurus purpureus]MCO6009903.1 sugar ABC transporter ATP-binding protein [Actinoallomurus purpureus]